MNTSAIIIALKGILESDTIPANDRLEMVAELIEREALGSGITQALAERQRIFGIIERLIKEHEAERGGCDCTAVGVLKDVYKEVENV